MNERPTRQVRFGSASGRVTHSAAATIGRCTCDKTYKTDNGLAKHLLNEAYKETAQRGKLAGVRGYAHVTLDADRLN